MSGRYESQAAFCTLPTGSKSDAFTAAGVNTGGLDLNDYMGTMVSLKTSEAAAVRAGASTASAIPTAGDWYTTKDVDYAFIVTPSTRYLGVLGKGAAGSVFVAKTTEI